MQSTIDFMGDESVWYSMVPGVVIRRRPGGSHLPRWPTAYFIDSHWTAQKAGDAHVFDPYDYCQKPGTHKFCQTFCICWTSCRLTERTGSTTRRLFSLF